MVSATYSPISNVAAREMRVASLDARRPRSARQPGQRSPQARPTTRSPHFAQGTSGNPPRDSTTELLGGSRSAQIPGADPVGHDGLDHTPPNALGAVELAHVVEHHRGGEHLGG